MKLLDPRTDAGPPQLDAPPAPVAFGDASRNDGAAMTEPSVQELLSQASGGDQNAWDALVDRFGGLVWKVARSFRLDPASAADVSQTTWLRLVEHMDRIRQPERLAAWLATTARHEAFRLIRHKQRYVPTVAFEQITDPAFSEPLADLLQDERAASVTRAFLELSDDCQELLRLATCDPPLEYVEIAAMIDRPVGSIGPTRGRCLEQLRRRLGAIDPNDPMTSRGKP